MSSAFSISIEPEVRRRTWSSADLLSRDDIRRDNEDDDAKFYQGVHRRPFFAETTDRAIRAHHARLIPSAARRVLDLMSSLQSHLDPVEGRKVIGLGLNAEEMARNPELCDAVIHDVNRNPRLPFDDASFDAVVCAGSIDLVTQPLELMRDVARVLVPGGVLVVTFTDRMIQPKCIHAWRDNDNEGRIVLATSYFSFSGAFLRPMVEVEEIKTPGCIIHGPGATFGDEVLSVVWGYRPPASQVTTPRLAPLERLATRNDRECPWCGQRMKLWQPPETPWEMDYGVELLHVCFNDDCPYFLRGRQWCRRNGMRCSTYRHSRNPVTGKEGPLPVPTRWALRAGILEEH